MTDAEERAKAKRERAKLKRDERAKEERERREQWYREQAEYERLRREQMERFQTGVATREDIIEAVYWVHAPGFRTEEEHETSNQYLGEISQAYWVDILLDHLKDTPKTSENAQYYRLSIDELLGLVLRKNPTQIYKIAPLFEEESTFHDGIMALNYMESAEALPILETLFERSINFGEQEAIDLLDAVQSIGGEAAHQAFERLCHILSARIQASPRLQLTVETAFAWEKMRGN